MCPSGWSEIGGKCYKHFKENVTWKKARTSCQDTEAGADLLSIHSQEEQEAVAKMFDERSGWLGGQRKNDDGGGGGDYNDDDGGDKNDAFGWADGSSWDYSNWADDQPEKKKDCVEMGEDSKWYSKDCSDSRPFVCCKFSSLEYRYRL